MSPKFSPLVLFGQTVVISPNNLALDGQNRHFTVAHLLLKDNTSRLLGSVPEPFSLSVLRRLGSIFTSVYAAVQKLKKAFETAEAEASVLVEFTNHVKDSELASLFGKLKYKENLIDNIYETKKNKSLVSAIPLSTAFISTSIIQDFQDSPNDEEDTRSSYEYINDLEEEYQARALLAKSKRFFKKGTQRFSSAKATDQTECHKYGKKERVSSDDNEMVEVKVLMTLAEENNAISKEGARNGKWVKISMRKWTNPLSKRRILGVDHITEDPSSSGQKDLVFVKSSADDTKVSIHGVERLWLSETEGFILPNNDTGRILPAESKRNTTDPLVAVIDSSVIEYDSANESSVYSTLLSPLKKLDGAEPISGSKTIKSHLRSKSTFKAETLKGVIINHPQLRLRVTKALQLQKLTQLLLFKRGEALQAKKVESSNVNKSKTPTKRHMTGVKSYLHKSVEQPGPKVVFRDDSTCTTEGYGSIKCNGIFFTKIAFVNGLKYNLISISQLCDAKYIVQFDEKRGIIFNSNKEVVIIALTVRDVYVLDMTSSAQESCFFAKASENLNWLWHKRLAHLNFKTINKLAKQNLVIGLPSLVYSKDKPCSSCEKGKHHRASFKTKQTSSIKKCLHLLHMDLFGPVTPRSINHEKYTLVIVDEYSRYTWVYFLKKKSQAPETIMSFIKRVENQNDIKVKQLRTDNGTEFRNSILVNFCDEKGISQNFSSPYTPEQNGVAERKNRTLIEAARTMLSGSVFSKQYWTEAVATACYTQNRSTIVKRHLKTPYEIFHHLEKFDEKADDGYLLRYSLVYKAFRVFNTRRQQTEETYHIIFDESPDAIKFSKPSVDNINIAENERYPPDEYLHPYEPSQRYQTNNNDVSFIEPYECLEPVVLETEVSSNQNGQTDQYVQNDEISNDDHSEHSNHTNDEQIIDNLPKTEDIQISEHSSSPRVEDTSVQNTIPIPNPPLPIPSVVTPAPQDRWSQDKHIELVNIIGNPRVGMLTRAMAKELSAASAHECLFVDFLSEEEPKKVYEALKHPGWVDTMQDELNQFARNKVWTLVPAPYGKTIIGSKWVFKNKRD
ncbi:retrovirus-related pol polyprotein from transposon TNT 1-94 [Tanacetum coccineum]